MAMDLDKIQQLMELMKTHDLNELQVKMGELEFKARRGERKESTFIVNSTPGLVQPQNIADPAALNQPNNAMQQQVETPAAPKPAEPAIPENVKEVCSPIVGTFYRCPNPDSPPYVEIGDHVEKDAVICIVEAMKVMNEIKADTKGVIRKILVENSTPVEYGQPLFLVEPA